jgi:uncharacterized membrane protein
MALAARRRWGALVIAATVGYETLVHVASTRADVPSLLVVPLAGLPHAAAYLFLLWLFGRTLRPGKEALITSVARRHYGGPVPPYLERYTRRLTAAWCIFFAAQLIVSAGLLTLASHETWSLFVNVLNLPLVAAMFAAEYLYRMVRLRGLPHATLTQSIVAFAKHMRLSDG